MPKFDVRFEITRKFGIDIEAESKEEAEHTVDQMFIDDAAELEANAWIDNSDIGDIEASEIKE